MHRKIPLPRGWKRRVRSSVLQILALSHYTFTALLARAALSKNRQVRLQAQIDRRNHEIALLQEEARIKDARMERVPPHRRPHYVPLERMAILELRAARGWSARQVAERFHITATTLGSWMARIFLTLFACCLVPYRSPTVPFLNLLDSTICMPFFKRPESVDGYTTSASSALGLVS